MDENKGREREERGEWREGEHTQECDKLEEHSNADKEMKEEDNIRESERKLEK